MAEIVSKAFAFAISIEFYQLHPFHIMMTSIHTNEIKLLKATKALFSSNSTWLSHKITVKFVRNT